MPVSKKSNFPHGWGTPGISMLLMLLVWSCTPKHLSEDELKAYVAEREDLSKSMRPKGYRVTVTYRPTDLLIAQELGGEFAVNTEELTRLQKKYEPWYYFILSLSKDGKEALYGAGSGYDQFSDMVQTLSFRMAGYVNMTTAGKDTIEVADYVFPRTYGMGGSTDLMFVFNKEETLDDEWVQFNMKEFGMGLGNQTFRFKGEDLENVPKLNFKVTGAEGG